LKIIHISVKIVSMSAITSKRSQFIINILAKSLWPFIKFTFQLKVTGLENLPESQSVLFVSNHNVGALIESHSVLFITSNRLPQNRFVLGFTHPSIFRLPIFKNYFEWIGAVPATYEVAKEVLNTGHSLMIFPGGNQQALRPISQYKKNSFRDSHGWAKIALENNVPVIPITFKGSHFVNPIFFSGEWVSKLLIIPKLLGLKYASVSLAQIVLGLVFFFFTQSYLISYLVFILSPIAIIIPFPVSMKIHPPRALNLTQDALEDEVATIMNSIYK
jgi:1-acyl-sn-glycerol-3-phosphate acyltransferase